MKKESYQEKYLRIEDCGFDVDIIGMDRVRSSGKRLRAAYRENGVSGLRDARNGNSGRSSERELSLEEKYARLEAQHHLLKAENELLKKIRFAERGMKK
jgi:transposase